MNIEFFKNFAVLAEEKNISRTAARLFISRSALNRQLLQTEQRLGQPLFRRLGNSLELTYLGTIYLDMVKQVLSTINRNELLMSSVHNCTHGELSFGISTSFAVEVLSKLFPLFHERYPGITIKLTQADSSQLAKLLRNGKLDLAVISSFDTTPDLKTELLQESEIHLCAPLSHPKAHLAGKNSLGQYLQCDLDWFKNDYFCMQGPSSPLYDLLRDVFNRTNFVPRVSISQATRSIIVPMVSKGIACAFLTDFYPNQPCNFVKFALKPRAYYTLMLAYPDSYTPSVAEQYFIDVLLQCFPFHTESPSA